MILRKACATDAPTMWAVRVSAIRRQCATHYPPETIDAWASTPMPDSFPARVGRECFVIAEQDLETGPGPGLGPGTEMLGFAALKTETGVVDAVFVHPAHAGVGVGQRLLAWVEQQACALGLEVASLTASLNAVSFYTRMGYQSAGNGVFRTSAGIELGCVYMAKKLVPATVSASDSA